MISKSEKFIFFKASEICQYLDLELIGNDIDLIKVTSTSDLQENSLYFCRDLKFVPKKFPQNVFGIVSINSTDYISGGSYAISSAPRKHFIKAINKFFKRQVNYIDKVVNSEQANISSEANTSSPSIL